MKKRKKWLLMAALLGIAGIGCVTYIVNSEKDRQYPEERYMEKQNRENEGIKPAEQDASDKEQSEENRKENGHCITYGKFTYEILAWERIDDTEIETQETYPEEHFRDGIPDADYEIEMVYDYEALFSDYPGYEELFMNRYTYEQDDYFAQIEKYEIDEASYRQTTHPETRYFFFRMKITNTTDKDQELVLNELNLIHANRNNGFALYTDGICYFDKAVYTEGEERLHQFTWYNMKPGETLECTVGYEMRTYGIKWMFPEEDDVVYIGIISPQMESQWINPVVSKNVVRVDDLPPMEE